MKREKAGLLKYWLGRAGALVPQRAIYNLNGCINYLETGRWLHVNGYRVPRRVERREQLFDLMARGVSQRRVLYLEFGVFEGAVTRYWSKLLRNPESNLHGFDSFEGLPEDWASSDRRKGYFSVDGRVPEIEDRRVRFYKGWFDQTLPAYQPPANDVLILILDADLYSSTRYVLERFKSEMRPGTYIYFDEFNHRFDELRAFDEFTRATGMRFAVAGASRCLDHVAFQVI